LSTLLWNEAYRLKDRRPDTVALYEGYTASGLLPARSKAITLSSRCGQNGCVRPYKPWKHRRI